MAEIAPSHALVLDIFRFAWLNGMAAVVEKHLLVNQITDTMRFLVSSFMGTDGVTLLDFLGSFLRDAHPDVGTSSSGAEFFFFFPRFLLRLRVFVRIVTPFE